MVLYNEGSFLYSGFKVIMSPLCVVKKFEQVRFPKSKKKRIKNKWKKRIKNFGIVEKDIVIQHGNTLYVSERIYKSIKNL